MTNGPTPFGMTVRRLRIDKKVNLKKMADDLELSSAYLSAVENGKKRITEKFLDAVCAYFSDQGIGLSQWKELADESNPDINVDLSNWAPEDRHTMHVFAREFDRLDPIAKAQIRRMLEDGANG